MGQGAAIQGQATQRCAVDHAINPRITQEKYLQIQDRSNLEQEHSLQEAYAIHAWAANSQGHTLPILQR